MILSNRCEPGSWVYCPKRRETMVFTVLYVLKNLLLERSSRHERSIYVIAIAYLTARMRLMNICDDINLSSRTHRINSRYTAASCPARIILNILINFINEIKRADARLRNQKHATDERFEGLLFVKSCPCDQLSVLTALKYIDQQ